MLNAEGGGHACGLSEVEDDGLEAGCAVGHVGDGYIFFAGEEAVELFGDEGGEGDSEGGACPASAPGDGFGGEGDVTAGVVVVVGVVADDDRGAAEVYLVAAHGADVEGEWSGGLACGEEVLFADGGDAF